MSYQEPYLATIMEGREQESSDNGSVASRRKYKKYRPITQSFYGVHHHKAQPAPSFSENLEGIRNESKALNNFALGIGFDGFEREDSIEREGSIKLGGLPLKNYRTMDDGSTHSTSVHEDYLATTNSQLLQSNLSRFMRFRNQDSTQTVDSGQAFRPSKALSILFSKRASSLFENHADDERQSLLTDIEEGKIKEEPFKEETSNMPVPDYENMNLLDYCLLPITFFPPVFLGLILNFLNAVSYGMIIFPTQIPIFKDFGPDGIAMFLVSTAISQFVYSIFGSGFPCAAGGFMLEVVPFLHIIVQTIMEDVGSENQSQVVATTMVAYALSSIITGAVFFALGYFKLGNLVGFFPRHILVGCIGGVGYFLCQTALEVVSKVKLSYYELDCWLEFLKPRAVGLWGTSVLLALTLKYLQRRINSPILLPFFYMMVPVVFFTIVKIFNLDTEMLQEAGWLFPTPDNSKPFYNFYLHFSFENTSFSTLPKLIPIMLALTFFGILHVPINVPAVAVTTKTDVYDVNDELIGHGWSNTLSGLFGSLQNYLMYSSSVLFFKSGGNDRYAGVMLAIATTLIWMCGTWFVAYIPCIVLGSVIFHLGMELFKEGVYETYGVMTPLEYGTIWVIVVAMALLGFVEGVFVGIALACLFFVYLYSQRTPIRSSYSGLAARSTIRRAIKQRQYLELASNQIHVIKLQGFMFFGTIDSVEQTIRSLLSGPQWEVKPISFLVLDLTLVTGVDFSAAEAFIRIRRVLSKKRVYMILCGLTPESDVGLALHAVGIWDTSEGLSNTFHTLNNALEWCENRLLEAAYMRHINTTTNTIDIEPAPTSNDFSLGKSNSPRTSHLDHLRHETKLHVESSLVSSYQQPYLLLIQMFSDHTSPADDTLYKLIQHFVSITLPPGHVLWSANDPPNGLYIVEKGLLKVTRSNPDDTSTQVIESILPGTMVGELALFSNSNRPFTVTTQDTSQLWFLSKESFDLLSTEDPQTLIRFMSLALAYSARELSVLSTWAFGN